MVLLFLCCFPHLALNPPCFFVSLFLVFLGVLVCVCVCVCVFLVWFRWLFSFENGLACVLLVVRIRQPYFILKDVL